MPRLPGRFRVTDRLRAPLTGRPGKRIRERAKMMLQTVHNNYRVPQASSLYCVWTPRDENPGSPLVAIWIDSTMTVFEGECCAGMPEEAVEMNSEEPGSCAIVSRHLTEAGLKHTLQK